jgi:formylglycine-generating enzyme required for sulfatase activity
MKVRVFIISVIFCVSCTQKYPYRKAYLQRIPKEAPRMVLISGMDYSRGFTCDGSSIDPDSLDVYIGSFYMSKHEITNKDFCSFLNEDSIRINTALIKEIIAIGEGQNKIILKDGKYHSVKSFEHYPVVMVSWWGAQKYGEWLTAVIKKRNIKRDMYVASYRLPSEMEWIFATSMNKKQYGFRIPECNDSMDSLNQINHQAHDVRKDSLISTGIAGMNENVYEWIDDNFKVKKIVNDVNFDEFNIHEIELTPDALVRQYATIVSTKTNNGCGRIARLRTGFYSDTGFRIVQTYLGRSSGMEF